jgi:peroxiredoxin family protein
VNWVTPTTVLPSTQVTLVVNSGEPWMRVSTLVLSPQAVAMGETTVPFG